MRAPQKWVDRLHSYGYTLSMWTDEGGHALIVPESIHWETVQRSADQRSNRTALMVPPVCCRRSPLDARASLEGDDRDPPLPGAKIGSSACHSQDTWSEMVCCGDSSEGEDMEDPLPLNTRIYSTNCY